MTTHALTDLYAWITDTPDGPSLVGTVTTLGHTPLMSVQRRIAESLEPIARGHGRQTGQPVRLAHYREVVE